MKRLLVTLGVCVLCLPMVFVVWLLLATKIPRMDALTMKMPLPVRSMIADIVLQERTKPATQRANRLDPDSIRRAAALRKALSIRTGSISAEVYGSNGRQIDARKFAASASRAEMTGDHCGAADEYANAVYEVQGDDSAYIYSEEMGKSAWLCGSVSGARKGFETAIAKQQRFLKRPNITDAEVTEAHNDMLRDDDWLVLVYSKQHERALARQACSQSHPKWASCTCKLDGQGNNISCSAGS